jgi:hypothetical protein
MLILKSASKSRPSGTWSDDDYDVFDGERHVGRRGINFTTTFLNGRSILTGNPGPSRRGISDVKLGADGAGLYVLLRHLNVSYF